MQYIHTCIHTYIHTYMHACIHTYIHTYIQTAHTGGGGTYMKGHHNVHANPFIMYIIQSRTFRELSLIMYKRLKINLIHNKYLCRTVVKLSYMIIYVKYFSSNYSTSPFFYLIIFPYLYLSITQLHL